MNTKAMTHTAAGRFSTRLPFTRLVLASLVAATLQLSPDDALAREKLVATDQGYVAVLEASRHVLRRQNFASETLPFASREDRLAAEPMQWNEDASPDYGFQGMEFFETFDQEASSAGGGTSVEGADEEARFDFAEEWKIIDEMEEQPPKLEAEGGGAQAELDGDTGQSDGLDAGSFAGENFDGTHGVFTRYRGNHNISTWRTAPWNKIGKLYFTTPRGSRSYCTANVISARSIIATAAHCLYSRGQGWNRNFVFVPAERYGSTPYGTFSWSAASVPSSWISRGGRRWDVGLIRLRNNTANRPVTYYVGWLGRAWNQSYSQHLHSVGYASNISTQVTNICAAQSFFSGSEGADVLVKGCDMTFGASGGGWIQRYEPFSHAGNYVTGVVSGPHIGAFGTTYVGPRFSSSNIVPLCSALGC